VRVLSPHYRKLASLISDWLVSHVELYVQNHAMKLSLVFAGTPVEFWFTETKRVAGLKYFCVIVKK